MWRSSWRKARADLRGRPLQTALVFLVVLAAAATLSLAITLQGSSEAPYLRLRERSSGADAWVNISSGAAPSALAALPQVESIGDPYPVSWENQGIRKGSVKRQVALVGLGATLPAFDHPVVTSGRWLGADGRRELVLDAGAARLLDLRVGEQVALLRASGSVEFTVVGFAATASRGPDPINDPAFAYVLPDTLRELNPGAVFGADEEHGLRVGVRLRPGTPVIAFLDGARAAVGGQISVRLASDVQRNIEEANQFNVIFLQVFAAFALLAAGLIVANSVGGQVLAQLRDVGVLKAIGFTPAQVTASLVLQNLALAAAAAIAGTVLGIALAPLLLRQTAEVLGVPAAPRLSTLAIAAPLLAVLAVVGLFTVVGAWRAARTSPVAALGRGDATRPVRLSRLGTFAFRLPPAAALGVGDLGRRRARTAFTLVALILAVITATFTLGIEATFAKTMRDPSVIGGPPFGLGIDRDTVEDARARAVIANDPDVEAMLALYQTDARVGHLGFRVFTYDGVLDSTAWPVRSGRMPARPGEAALSTVLAERLHAAVGDEIPLTRGDGAGPLPSVRVVGIYASTEGEVLTTVPGTVTLEQPPTDYLVRLRAGADSHAVADRLIAATDGQFDVEVLSDTVAGLRDSWRPLLLGLNAVLFAVAGVNLTSNLLLGVRERRRELAILKTVGFTPRQLVLSVLSGGAGIALLATLLGIPLGLVATRLMFDALSSTAGIGTGIGALPGVRWMALLVPIAVGTTALASLFPATTAARIRVAEALRYE